MATEEPLSQNEILRLTDDIKNLIIDLIIDKSDDYSLSPLNLDDSQYPELERRYVYFERESDDILEYPYDEMIYVNTLVDKRSNVLVFRIGPTTGEEIPVDNYYWIVPFDDLYEKLTPRQRSDLTRISDENELLYNLSRELQEETSSDEDDSESDEDEYETDEDMNGGKNRKKKRTIKKNKKSVSIYFSRNNRMPKKYSRRQQRGGYWLYPGPGDDTHSLFGKKTVPAQPIYPSQPSTPQSSISQYSSSMPPSQGPMEEPYSRSYVEEEQPGRLEVPRQEIREEQKQMYGGKRRYRRKRTTKRRRTTKQRRPNRKSRRTRRR